MTDSSQQAAVAPEPEVARDEVVEGAGEQPAPADAPAEERAAELVQDDVEELRARAAQRDEYLALAQRTQADFENYRKRMARETQLAQERGVRKVVEELLPALDNLERALAAAEVQEEGGAGSAPDGSQEHHLTTGIRLVQSELVGALQRIGIESFSPRGEAFDPNQHEAMASQPVDGTEAGTVVEVLQQGYRTTGATVIRPARVVVAA